MISIPTATCAATPTCARGYRVLHFTNADVMEDAEAVARAIQQETARIRQG